MAVACNLSSQAMAPRWIRLLSSRTVTASGIRPAAISFPRQLSSTPYCRSEPLLNSLNTLTDEEEALRESALRFTEEYLPLEKVREMDENEQMDQGVIQALFEHGFMGIETAEEYGGAGASFFSACIAIETLARADASVSVMCDVQNTLVATLIRQYGSDSLKSKWLPRLAQDTIGSFALSEPDSGSDAFALRSVAEKVEGGYKLTGNKMWITNGAEADVFLIFANLDPSQGYRGITCFLAEKKDGVQVAKKESKLGIRASSTALITFDDIFVPSENLIGKEGQGYKIAIQILNEGRIGIGAQQIGIAMGAFEKAVPYAWQRKQFGQYVGDFQSMGHQFADIYTQIEAARLLVYNAARLKDEGRPFTTEAAQAKWFSSQVAKRSAEKAVEWAGGVGFTRETGIEKYFRDSMIGSIYEGTSNIQLETIAKALRKTYGP